MASPSPSIASHCYFISYPLSTFGYDHILPSTLIFLTFVENGFVMKKVVWIFAVIFIVALGIAYKMNLDQAKKQEHLLKVYNPIDIIEKSLVDSTLLRKGYGHTIGDFSFTNQYGETITQADIKEKIFVADYFFTTC